MTSNCEATRCASARNDSARGPECYIRTRLIESTLVVFIGADVPPIALRCAILIDGFAAAIGQNALTIRHTNRTSARHARLLTRQCPNFDRGHEHCSFVALKLFGNSVSAALTRGGAFLEIFFIGTGCKVNISGRGETQLRGEIRSIGADRFGTNGSCARAATGFL